VARPLLSPTLAIPARPLLPQTGGPQRVVTIGPVVKRLHRYPGKSQFQKTTFRGS
jgi:hypothetical protein